MNGLRPISKEAIMKSTQGETTIQNPAFQEVDLGDSRKTSPEHTSGSRKDEMKGFYRSGSVSGIAKRALIVAVGVACVLSVVAIAVSLTLLSRFGIVELQERCTCPQHAGEFCPEPQSGSVVNVVSSPQLLFTVLAGMI